MKKFLSKMISNNGTPSKGAAMLWIVFGILCFMWISARLVPDSIVDVFFSLLLYGTGTKGIAIARDKYSAKTQGENP